MSYLYKNHCRGKCDVKKKCWNDGFSVVELVVALAVMVVVIAGIISFFTSLSSTYTTQNAAAAVQQVARTGIDIMTRNIRMAGFNPLDKDPVGIVEASANKIRFHCDLNGSGAIETEAEPREDIAYLLNSNNQLIKQNNGNNRTNRSLVDNVSDLTFKYFDADDRETSNVEDIRTVEISLSVREKAGRDKFLSRTYSTRVICRNLGLHRGKSTGHNSTVN
jgi:type II secretory pathway component PulJ